MMAPKLPDGATKTDLTLLARVTGAVKGLKAGFESGWNPPGEPMEVQAPEGTKPRAFDFRPFLNKSTIPRSEESGGVTFQQLRDLADNCNLLRLVIETRKDQLSKVRWTWRVKVQPDEDPVSYRNRNRADKRVERLNKLFRFPDGENNWRAWSRKVLEDALVIDAVAIEPRWDGFGELVKLDVIDGATIKRLIDGTGRTPVPPQMAYQQVISGMVSAEWQSSELMYVMRNQRSNHVYGYSPVEQIILTVNQALRRALFQLSHYTEGNLPTAFVPVPDTWTLDDVKEMQLYWDELITGKPDEQAKVHFVPNGMDPIFPQQETLKDEFDEWLARVICYAFSVAHTPLVRNMNRATSEQQREQSDAEGMMVWMYYLKDLQEDAVLRWLGWSDVEVIPELERMADSIKQAQVDVEYIKIGVKSVDEVRTEMGKPTIGVGHGVITGKGFVPFDLAGENGAIAVAPPDSESPSEQAEANAEAQKKLLPLKQSLAPDPKTGEKTN